MKRKPGPKSKDVREQSGHMYFTPSPHSTPGPKRRPGFSGATPVTPTPRGTASRVISAAAAGVGSMWTAGVATTVTSANPAAGSFAAVAGGVVGAAMDWHRTAPGEPGTFLNKKKMAIQNSRVDKSAMKQTGKAKVKRVKKLKVSNYLKKAVKQVVAGSSAHGYYKRTFTGVVGVSAYDKAVPYADLELSSSSTANGGTAFTVMGTTQTTAYVGSAPARSIGGKTLFNTLCLKNTNGTGFRALANCDLNFFTPAKLWHAASVLFNNKTESADPYATTTGNLGAISHSTTGVINSTVPQNLKIELKSSHVAFNFKNLSARNVFVDVYECVSMLKFNISNPLNDLVTVARVIQDSATEDKIVQLYEIDGENNTSENFLFITCGDVDGVSIAKSNGWKWKYVKKTMMLSPGENCAHVMKGPTGMFDFARTMDGPGVYKVNGAHKDWSKHLIIACRPEPTLRDTSAVSNQGLRFTPQTELVYELFSTISIECTEVMSIAVPEIAGFVSTAVAAGSGQPLNLRKKRIMLTNLNGGVAGNVQNLVVSSEFNPVATTNTQGLL